MKEKCLFCEIVAGREPCVKVWENEDFLAIENKYPVAPKHILIIPKEHINKKEWCPASSRCSSGLRRAKMSVTIGHFWGKMMEAVFEVVRLLALDRTGYKLVNNGAGYNHFEHEHMHILGGTRGEPAGKT